MTIAIDVSRAVNEKAGVGRFTYNLVKSILSFDKNNHYILIASFLRGTPAKEKILKSFSRENVELKILKIPGKVKETLWGSKLPMAQKIIGKIDFYLAPTFLDVIHSLKVPQVVVIHDLTTFKFPDHLGQKLSKIYNQKTIQAVKKASKIIAISKATKSDLISLLKINADKITVIYPGQTDFEKIALTLPAGLKSQHYILSVGTVEPRKNLVELFKAYSLLPLKLQETYPLAICGAKGWNTGEIYETLVHLKLEKKVKFLGYVSDTQLGRLYKEAKLFILPSMYEGFGIPVLEALSFGTPVVTSNISSLPEVVGKAAILVNPNDAAEIAKAMQRVLEHQNEEEKLRKLAPTQAKKFSWDTAAKKTLEIIQSTRK